MRDLRQRRRRLPLARGVVGAGGREAGVADQQTGHLVVRDIVSRRSGENDLGPDSPQGLGDSPPRIVVVEDRQVAELETDIIRPDHRGRLACFLAANRRDRLGIVFGTAAVARCHRRDRHLRNRPRAAGSACPRTGTPRRRDEHARPARESVLTWVFLANVVPHGRDRLSSSLCQSGAWSWSARNAVHATRMASRRWGRLPAGNGIRRPSDGLRGSAKFGRRGEPHATHHRR